MAKLLLSACRLINKPICIIQTPSTVFDNINVFRRTQHTGVDGIYDVVISGGGMVGAAMACSLGQEELFKGKRVALLESSPRPPPFKLKPSYSNRTCALNPATVDLLNSFGAWDQITSMRCQPVKRMQVWESCSDAMISFNQDDLVENLAYIVENDVILSAIMNRLEAMAEKVEVIYNAKVKEYDFPATGVDIEKDSKPWVDIHMQNGDSLQTRLLIGADGMRSLVRKTAGFHTVEQSYDQSAVVATLQLPENENTVAWQRFLPSGPVAMLPLSSTNSCLIWSTTIQNAKTLLSLSEEGFVDAVNDAFWHERDKISIVDSALDVWNQVLQAVVPGGTSGRQLPPTVVGVEENTRAMFPLGVTHSSQYVKPRVALIGDAAHRLHPLAGQGVNLGFGDVACLRDLLRQGVLNGSDLGSLTHLLDYETSRQRKVLPTLFAVHGLQALYGTDLMPIVLLRSLGLQTTNAMKYVKDKIIQQASV